MTIVLYWDIDGTLLDTKRAGIIAWEKTTAAIVGREIGLTGFRTAGLTDIEIGKLIGGQFGGPENQRYGDEIVRLYEGNLPATLPLRDRYDLPNVRETLELTHERKDILSLLLTGNTRTGARAKPGYFGLAEFFIDGAFSGHTTDRVTIAYNAMKLANTLPGGSCLTAAYVIGDTPKDILCAQAIAVPEITVATGVYSLEDLEEHDPWWTIAGLPEPQEFVSALLNGPT